MAELTQVETIQSSHEWPLRLQLMIIHFYYLFMIILFANQRSSMRFICNVRVKETPLKILFCPTNDLQVADKCSDSELLAAALMSAHVNELVSMS